MRLGTYLGIFGTIFGNMVVASILYLITTGSAFHSAPLTQDDIKVEQQTTAGQNLLTIDNSSDIVANNNIPQNCELSDRFPEKVTKWCSLITYYSDQRNLPPDLVAAVVLQESGGNPLAYSHSGAVGLMQVMPSDGLAASFMCKNGPCFSNRPPTAKLQDPEFNIAYGTRMLANLKNKYGNLRDALKAYGPMDVGYYYADIVLGHYKRYGN